MKAWDTADAITGATLGFIAGLAVGFGLGWLA